MPRKRPRNRSRAQVKGGISNAATPSTAGGDQYKKYLPEWMKDGTTAPRPRVRRARPQRPAGGYTPGKFALTDPLQ